MSILDATTGHSAPQERKSAKFLYAILILAIVASVLLFAIVGLKDSMNPTKGSTAIPMDQSAPAGNLNEVAPANE